MTFAFNLLRKEAKNEKSKHPGDARTTGVIGGQAGIATEFGGDIEQQPGKRLPDSVQVYSDVEAPLKN
jgi:hypothetical protein